MKSIEKCRFEKAGDDLNAKPVEDATLGHVVDIRLMSSMSYSDDDGKNSNGGALEEKATKLDIYDANVPSQWLMTPGGRCILGLSPTIRLWFSVLLKSRDLR